MTPILLEKFLKKYIVPMFTGAELTEHEEKPPAWQKRRVFLHNECEMYVRAAIASNKYFNLRRSQAFEKADADFVECFVEKLHYLGDKVDEGFIEDSINAIFRRSVAERIAPQNFRERANNIIYIKPLPDTSEFLAKILAQFEAWAEQTYEGRKIAAAVGVNATRSSQDGVNLLEIFDKPFGMVLANGLETFLTADAGGHVVGHEPLNNLPVKNELFSPLRFCHLAEWSKNGRVGIGLTRNGEILVFANEGLIFAKRRGIWHHFTHNAVVKRMALRGCFYPPICKAVYRTCLDVSFAKTGGGIALIKRTKMENFGAVKIVDEKDFLGAKNPKGQFLKTIIGKPFNELDRHLRQDIVAMDGATILDYHGNVIAAGAIVEVIAGSDGGGRLAAARALSKFGLAIKISSDGGIRGFKGGVKDGQQVVEEIFTIG